MRTHVRFCTSSDGVRLAFAISGKGPPLVRAPHWFTHLEHDWTNPAMRAWVEDLSRRYMLLRFDQRGTGLSAREVPEISFETQVRDLECIIDAAGFERFALLGLSQGAASAVAYAAQHPERVSHLILHGGFVRGWAKRGDDPERLESRRTQIN
jgi:pimeloyl-ACP methyl ester carboxylesterase